MITYRLAATWQLDRRELLLIVLLEGGRQVGDDVRRRVGEGLYVCNSRVNNRSYRYLGENRPYLPQHRRAIVAVSHGMTQKGSWPCLPRRAERPPQRMRQSRDLTL